MTEFATTPSGDRVAYDRYGSGPALIFVAGAGPYRAIDPVTTLTAQAVADTGCSAFVYDRLGRGQSPAPGRLDLERELATIAALIEVAGGSAVLCGHSSGCSISLAAAASGLPVDGLVLWEAPIGPPDGGAREWAAEVDRLIELGEPQAAQLHYMKDMPPEFLERIRSSPMWAALVAQVGSVVSDGESLAWAESAPLAELCAGISVPVEVLVGTETYPIMLEAMGRITAAIPHATSRRMPGAGHSWEPEAMAAELAAFVTRAVRGPVPARS